MVVLSGSLNVMVRMPVPVAYVADDTVGFMVSCIVIVWSAVSAIRLPDVSCMAPASMSSWGVIMAFTVVVSLVERSNVIESVPLVVMILLYSVTPPVLVLDSRM